MSASNAIEAIIGLGHELSETKNAAHDLWTWLPSYKRAQAAHGDYASNHTPSALNVIREATSFIAHGCAPTPEQQEEAGDLYRCPCGEDQDGEEGNKHGAWPMVTAKP